MQIKIDNLIINAQRIEDFFDTFHDLGYKREMDTAISNNEFRIVFPSRPSYSDAKQKKWLGLLPIWYVPQVQTTVSIYPVTKIVQLEADATRGNDYFLHLRVADAKNELMINGVLNKFALGFTTETVIKIEDISKPDWQKVKKEIGKLKFVGIL